MNKSDILEKITAEANVTWVQAEMMLNIFADGIKTAIASGEKVHLKGFGTFERRKRAPKRCKNPRTGEEMLVEAYHTVIFRPSEDFKRQIAKEDAE